MRLKAGLEMGLGEQLWSSSTKALNVRTRSLGFGLMRERVTATYGAGRSSRDLALATRHLGALILTRGPSEVGEWTTEGPEDGFS